MPPNTQETHLKVLRHLEDNPDVTQRELAAVLGISLGKTNYCIKALIDKGLVKAKNFKNSANKRAYLYILTPKGIETKTRISVRFLQRKNQGIRSPEPGNRTAQNRAALPVVPEMRIATQMSSRKCE